MSEHFLFAVFPYLAVALAAGGGVFRALRLRDTLTARSSQLLESRLQRAGAVPWHFAILIILLAHFAALFFPLGGYVVEIVGLALGLLALLGILTLLVRRFLLATSTGFSDWLVLVALLMQVASGVYVAFVLRWGAGWFGHTAAPWLGSLARLDPQLAQIAVLPPVAKLHFVNAFVLIALLPLTRLVHIATVPISYLWRPPQLVSRGSARATSSP